MTLLNERWDRIHLRKALDWAKESKDPATRVGCVIVGPDKETRSTGFNGFARGVKDTPERLNDREMKLRLTVHAERNAICAAARIGIPLKGCTLYIAACRGPADEMIEGESLDDKWGGPPCLSCAIEIIQAGIVEVVSYPLKGFSKWRDDLLFSKGILMEAGVRCREVNP